MTREDKYLLGCLFAIKQVIAINQIRENGSSDYNVNIDGEWETIPWAEICEWIEKKYGIEEW